jgi:hypothetical protein
LVVDDPQPSEAIALLYFALRHGAEARAGICEVSRSKPHSLLDGFVVLVQFLGNRGPGRIFLAQVRQVWMIDGMCADVPTRLEQFANFIPGHELPLVGFRQRPLLLGLGLDPRRIDKQRWPEPIALHDVVHIVSHRDRGMVEVDHERASG